MRLQTEFDFTLPRGYIDDEGCLHQRGIMRLATAADEILPLKDPRVQRNQAYLPIIILSRVISKLGTISIVNPSVIEGLYASDLAYLQEFYNQINKAPSSIQAVCPKCKHGFTVEPNTGREE